MPRRPVDEMTVSALNKAVRAIEEGRAKPRLIRVGGVSGLALNVRMRRYASGEAVSASWVLRRAHRGKRRDFALGGWPDVTLAQARERARIALDQLWAGIDPKAERKAAGQVIEAEALARTFREAAHDYFSRKVRGRINARDEAKWSGDLEAFVFPVVGDMPVDQIETRHMVAVTERPHIKYGSSEPQPLWHAVPERAKRCLKKVEAILTAEMRLGHRTGENPATWRGHLSDLLPKPEKVKAKGHQPALSYAQMPAFTAALRGREPSPSAWALEFLILTAARSGEVRGAKWSEIDSERGLWTIPAERMKASKDHRVALSDAALAILKATPPVAGTDLIWPGSGLNKPMSDATLAALVRKMHASEVKAGREGWLDPVSERTVTPHGFRSTFRVWAAEQTSHPYEMVEMALAHSVGTAVERAYNRTDMVEKRRTLMQDWAGFAFCLKTPECYVAGCEQSSRF